MLDSIKSLFAAPAAVRAFLVRDSLGFFYVVPVGAPIPADVDRCDVGTRRGDEFVCATGRFEVFVDDSAARAQ